MDWDNDYYTFSDTNIEYIWRFLKDVHGRGWLYLGHRSNVWCPRCGTSISQHELVGYYEDAPIRRCTSASRCSAIRASRSSSGRRPPGRCRRTSRRRSSPMPSTACATTAAGSRSRACRTRRSCGGPGAELVGLAYEGPFDELPAAAERRPSRDPVGRGDALRGNRDRPHRAGRRHRGLRALAGARPAGADADRRGRPLLRRLRLAARALDGRREGADDRRPRRARPARRGRADHPPLSRLLALPHAAVFRIVDEWFISRRRDPPADARRERDRRVDAGLLRQADGRLAAQHGRLEHLAQALLRAAAALLPVRVRAPERDRLAGGAARSARPAGLEQLRELHRPWIDEVPISCETCGKEVRRDPRGRRRLARRGHRPLLDARLAEPRVAPGRLRGRGVGGPVRRRPPRPLVLGDVVPGRLGLGVARADPAVVLLAVVHVGGARSAGAVPARAGLREAPRRVRAARCTSRGATRSTRTRRPSGWAPT